MLDFLSDWFRYPFAETVHWAQGVITGWCAAHGLWKKEPSSALVAILIAIGFIAYEITEQWKVNDNAYRDIENYWLLAMLTGIIYTISHFYRQYKQQKDLL